MTAAALIRLLAPVFVVVLLQAQSGGVGPGGSGSEDIDSLLRQMTLDEKLALLRGARDPESLGQAGYWRGLPRLGIPPLRFADGPAGVLVLADATAMPAPVLLAATFSTDLARRFGEVLGREAKALRQDVLLAPYVNIVRDPLFRRVYSTLGEDPALSAALGAAIIQGVQQQGVLAQVKHIAVYNGPDSVFLDERTLREIYLPVFESSLRAGVASVMCAYNRVNGLPACHNPDLLNRWLRQEMGFEGFVTSDWGAVYGPDALAAGTDLEMPGREIAGRGGPYFSEPLKTAIEKGQIPLSAVDQALSRILSQLDRFGLLRSKPPAPPPPIDVESHAATVRQIAEQGAVLLQNDGILPLGPEDLSSLAVIGPNARQLVTGYLTERAFGFPHRLVPPLEALRRLAPEAHIRYALGGDLTGIALAAPALANAPLLDFTGANAIAAGESFTWSGTLRVEEPGEYTFMVQTGVGQGAAGYGEILIGGRTVVRSTGFRGFGAVERPWSSLLPTIDGLDNARATVFLESGSHRLELRAVSTGKAPLRLRFAWMHPALRRRHREEAVRLASSSRAAIVFAWHETGSGLSLAEDQDELIRRVAAANPRTVVVLNTGSAVAMPWRNQVRAILQMWYPGQEGGWATANLLLGKVNPSGKLPVTFPARLEDTPVRAPGHPERWAPPAPPGATGVNPVPPAVRFTEGLLVGYRWYDANNIEPLFPFGYGLSYTTFEYSALRVRRRGDGVEVSFTLKNTGRRAGEEVAQVYLGPPQEDLTGRPPRSLAAFTRVSLSSGEARRITLRLDERALSYWSAAEYRWRQSQRPRDIFVGGSSRDLPLRGRIPPTTRGSPAPRRG